MSDKKGAPAPAGREAPEPIATASIARQVGTAQDIQDAKERCEASEIISNLTPEEIEAVRDGYTRVVTAKKRVTPDDLEALDKEAYGLGYSMKNFSEWYDSQPFCVRSNAKMRTVRESYERGVDAWIEKQSAVLRLCVFIQGERNSGKTHVARLAMQGKFGPTCR